MFVPKAFPRHTPLCLVPAGPCLDALWADSSLPPPSSAYFALTGFNLSTGFHSVSVFQTFVRNLLSLRGPFSLMSCIYLCNIISLGILEGVEVNTGSKSAFLSRKTNSNFWHQSSQTPLKRKWKEMKLLSLQCFEICITPLTFLIVFIRT